MIIDMNAYCKYGLKDLIEKIYSLLSKQPCSLPREVTVMPGDVGEVLYIGSLWDADRLVIFCKMFISFRTFLKVGF